MSGARSRSAQSLTGDERGSVLILTAGYAALALTVVMVTVDATNLYLANQSLDASADAAALAAADSFELVTESGQPRAVLTSALVAEYAQRFLDDSGSPGTVVQADAPDGASARVTLRMVWHPVVFSPFVPDGVTLTSTAISRTAFR